MNYKRAVIFSAILWVIIFVMVSIIMFLPFLSGKDLAQHIVWWFVSIPLFAIWAKIFFKNVYPSFRNGLVLGLFGIVVGTALDAIITVPLFVKSYTVFFGNWMLYVGYVICVLTTAVSAAEFDATLSPPENANQVK